MSPTSIRLVLATLILTGCSSSQPDNSKAKLTPPDLAIRQLGGMASIARKETGPISVNLQVDITNRSGEPITLERLQLESVADGAYTLRPTSRPFDKVIEPGAAESFKLWAPAEAQATVLGANGPVTLRVIAFFRSPVGSFREVYIRQINERNNGEASPR